MQRMEFVLYFLPNITLFRTQVQKYDLICHGDGGFGKIGGRKHGKRDPKMSIFEDRLRR